MVELTDAPVYKIRARMYTYIVPHVYIVCDIVLLCCNRVFLKTKYFHHDYLGKTV